MKNQRVNVNRITEMLVAKTDHEENDKCLPLIIHLRDTAEIMTLLAKQWIPENTRQLLCSNEDSYCMSEEELYKICKFLGLTHDIGKSSIGFQSKILINLPYIRDLIESYGIEIPSKSIETLNHALTGELILLSLGCNESISAVVGAHHGRPQEDSDVDVELQFWDNHKSLFYENEEDNINGIWKQLIDIALNESGYTAIEDLPELDLKQQILFSGLLIMADWIASNVKYFPLISADDLETIKLSELYPNRIKNAWNVLKFPDCWESNMFFMDEDDFQERFCFAPNEVQKTVIDVIENSDEPGIIILEAHMGIGKTEAALAGAEILSSMYGNGGIFFGMPTQATANGLFPRMMNWAEQQTESARLSIKLAHGMAEYNDDYRNLFEGSSNIDYEDEKEGLIVHSWFKGKKQSLLSNFVIGTVDQLLMMALKQKHVMLRHLGMSGKVVIIDEAHAYDAYMNTYLDMALQWLGIYRIPVIILSATLPSKRREELVAAYLCRRKLKDNSIGTQRGYPLLTWTDGKNAYQKIIDIDSDSRDIDIELINDDEIIKIISECVSVGGCICIIVNTVKRAQSIYLGVSSLVSDAEVILFHSQFIMPDRADIENKVIKKLGKDSGEKERKGTVIIGTQVLEQSLDIDADVMITDLCPMDLLLQRMGRLQRHRNHDQIRPDKLKRAKCFVVTPFDDGFESGAEAIYGEYILMRTKAMLPDKVSIPESIPVLVQDVYNEEISIDIDSESYSKAKHDFYLRNSKKKQKARAYLMDSPADNIDNIHSWLSQADIYISDVSAQAKVRDSNISIEVIVLVEKDGQISFLPWQNNGRIIEKDIIPSEEEALMICRQKIKLPGIFCNIYNIDKTIYELEKLKKIYFSEWEYSAMMKEELILLLDENLSGNLIGYNINYSKENGLSYEIKKGE